MDEKIKRQLDEKWEIERYNQEKQWEIDREIRRKESIQMAKLAGIVLLGMFALLGLIVGIVLLTA